MSRRVLTALSVGTLLFVVQHALLGGVTVIGVHPELLLLFTVCCGLAGGVNWGAAAGFIAGLISDAFLPFPLGLSAFSFAIAGYLAGVLSDDTTSAPVSTALTAAASTATGLAVFAFAGSLTGTVHTSLGHVLAVIFVASLVNAIIALPVRRMLRSIRFNERDLAW